MTTRSDPHLTSEERAFVVERLERTRDDLLAVVEPLSEAQWNYRPSDEAWSIHLIVEHLGRVEISLLGQVELALGQTAFASEATVAGFGFPRRHIAAVADVGNLLGAGDDIAVAEQVDGRRAFGTMAGGAVLQDNGGDIAVEGRRPVRCFAAAGQAACSERDQQRSHCKSEIKQPIARVSLVGGMRSASRASMASARSWRVAVGRAWSKAV